MVRGASAVAGAPPTSGPASERYRRFLELDRPGVKAESIARELGTSIRTVERYRSASSRSPASDPSPAPTEEPPPVPATTPRFSLRRRQGLAERTLEAALTMAVMIRDEDAAACHAFVQSLPRDQQAALPYVLAALVPVDRPRDELLEWITWDEHGRPIPGVPVPTGVPLCVTRRVPATPATAKRHRDQRQPLCDPCRDAESTYRRNLYQANKRRTRAA
ncbi:hypothetical protein ACFOY2_45920 [Nonomuraea purpurea]|uniref:Helix-turn-helix domain-containing protein n=1 Tax=Nonomuraea purpurea TaxID=1849276 RepID=A0ABV8GKZ4_9ACTN